MTKRYLALLATVALVVIGMNEPVVATENVVGSVGAAVTELNVLGTVSGAIGGSVSGLSVSRTSSGVVGGSVVGAGSSGSIPSAIGGTVVGLSVLAAAAGGIGGVVGGSSSGSVPGVGSVGASVGGVGPSGTGGNGLGVTGAYGTAADASESAGDIADASVGGSNGSGVVGGDPSFMAGTTTYSDYPAIIGGRQNPDYTGSVFASTGGGDTSVGPTVMSTYSGDVSSSD